MNYQPQPVRLEQTEPFDPGASVWVMVGDKTTGPYSRAQLSNMMSAGTIGRNTLAARQGDPGWRPVGEFMWLEVPPEGPIKKVDSKWQAGLADIRHRTAYPDLREFIRLIEGIFNISLGVAAVMGLLSLFVFSEVSWAGVAVMVGSVIGICLVKLGAQLAAVPLDIADAVIQNGRERKKD
jgi:hypothetical protein